MSDSQLLKSNWNGCWVPHCGKHEALWANFNRSSDYLRTFRDPDFIVVLCPPLRGGWGRKK